MKFSEMPYQRPNLDEIKAQFAAVTQRFAAAPDYAAAKAAFLDEQTLNKHVDTLANLASIRNTIDTRDEFYDEEMNFWNAATPELQDAYEDAWKRTPCWTVPFRKDICGGIRRSDVRERRDRAQGVLAGDHPRDASRKTTSRRQYGKLIASRADPL